MCDGDVGVGGDGQMTSVVWLRFKISVGDETARGSANCCSWPLGAILGTDNARIDSTRLLYFDA